MEIIHSKKVQKLIDKCEFQNQLDWSEIADIYIACGEDDIETLAEKCIKFGNGVYWVRNILKVYLKNNNDILYFESGEEETLDIVKTFIKVNKSNKEHCEKVISNLRKTRERSRYFN